MSTRDLLFAAASRGADFIDGVEARHVGGRTSVAALRETLGGPLPRTGADPAAVVEALARDADPGLVATIGPRYFGFVTGGALPVAVAADWLASAWDQNAGLYVMAPAAAVLEDVVAGWLLELLDLPPQSSVGFVTGCHMANVTCLAAARHEVLRRAGWAVERDGLQRAPRLTVVVGDEVHVSAVGALRMLGIGADELVRVPVDGQGRMRADALGDVLRGLDGPIVVCAQAGNVATGASDPLGDVVALAHARNAWVHVDGAFGLWAQVVPRLAPQVAGMAGADSWATDAHKWLNVPYDSGLAIVAHQAPHRAAMGLRASYLQRGLDEERTGMDWVPESSRRARVIPLYALLRTLGADGVRDLVDRTCRLAARMAARLSEAPGVTILNEVVLNQVLVTFAGRTGGAPAATRDVIARVQAEGTCWAGGATWQGHEAMRISVSNWSTTDADIDRAAEAILACHRAVVDGARG
ncbi:MAG: aminotransferase class V-fold PLP-dependent enzyme [Vicinamibacterales bacterium]